MKKLVFGLLSLVCISQGTLYTMEDKRNVSQCDKEVKKIHDTPQEEKETVERYTKERKQVKELVSALQKDEDEKEKAIQAWGENVQSFSRHTIFNMIYQAADKVVLDLRLKKLEGQIRRQAERITSLTETVIALKNR